MGVLTKMKRLLVLAFVACVFAAAPMYAQQFGAWIAQYASAFAGNGPTDNVKYCTAVAPNGLCEQTAQVCTTPCYMGNVLSASSEGEAGDSKDTANTSTGATVFIGSLQASTTSSATEVGTGGEAGANSETEVGWTDTLTITSETLPPGTPVTLNFTGTLAATLVLSPLGQPSSIVAWVGTQNAPNLITISIDSNYSKIDTPPPVAIQAHVGDSIRVTATMEVVTSAGVGGQPSSATAYITGVPSSPPYPPDFAEWLINIDPTTADVCYTTASGITYYTSEPTECTTYFPTPTGETTAFHKWGPADFSTIAFWQQTLTPTKNDFYNRIVMETNGNPGGGVGTDTCWFQGSMYAPIDTVSGGAWQVGTATHPNFWGYDLVGMGLPGVQYYTANNRVPCGFSFQQEMEIYANNQYAPYGSPNKGNTNSLGFNINSNKTVTSFRSGKSKTHSYKYPPTP